MLLVDIRDYEWFRAVFLGLFGRDGQQNGQQRRGRRLARKLSASRTSPACRSGGLILSERIANVIRAVPWRHALQDTLLRIMIDGDRKKP
jgi:hypothetical protein